MGQRFYFNTLPFLIIFLFLSNIAHAEYTSGKWFKTQLYFGLSKPGGGVSVAEWQAFQKEVIDGTCTAYTLEDSLGYWEKTLERSKILTVALPECEIPAVQKIAQQYAKRFNQQSVMLLKTPIETPQFIGKSGVKVTEEKKADAICK